MNLFFFFFIIIIYCYIIIFTTFSIKYIKFFFIEI